MTNTNAPRFFLPGLRAACVDLASQPVRVALPEAVAHHATRVLRLRPGQPVVLFDGEGGEYVAELDMPARGEAAARVREFRAIEREARVGITLVQGLCAQEKTDWLLEKCVEAGVREVVLVASARSVVRLDADRAQRRLARWQDLVTAACCQCGRNRVPAVHLAPDLQTALRYGGGGARWLLSPEGRSGLPPLAPAALTLAVGPEGGFTAEENALAQAMGYAAVRLGGRVLRTETAGLIAIAATLALGGEFA